MKNKNKTPIGYVAPLRSRAAITAWLLNAVEANSRPGYGMFTYDVKLHRLKTDFAHLAKLAKENGELASESPRYLAECEAIYNDNENSVWDTATEDAQNDVLEDVGYRMLWDGDAEAIADWGFEGRSNGWLALKRFEGVELGAFDAAELFAGSSFSFLRNLYRFLVQCNHDFRRPESEVEYKAAFSLFCNLCHNVKTDEEIEASDKQTANEAAERKY